MGKCVDGFLCSEDEEGIVDVDADYEAYAEGVQKDARGWAEGCD